MLKTLFTSASLLAALVAQTPQPAPPPPPSPAPSISPLPTPIPSITPAPTPVPLPTPTPSPVPSGTPSPSPSPLPTPLVLPDDAPPQILAVQISDPVVHGGETVTGTVITSTNVAAVEIRMAGRAIRMPRTDYGVWQLTYHMPHVPFFMRGTYTAQIVAMNVAGAVAERDVAISVR